MRKTKSVKILSKAKVKVCLLLCFVLAISLFVCVGSFSSIGLQKAYADTEAISFFTIDSETTKKASEDNGIRIDRIGTTDADGFKGYSGIINGLFQTSSETKIEFSFPKDSDAKNKYMGGYEFTFKVEDVSGEGAYFLVKYYYAQGDGGYQEKGRVAVIYVDENGKETFKSSSYNGDIANDREELEDLNTVCLPELRNEKGPGNTPVVGHMNLTWDSNGVLSVMAPLYNGKSSTKPVDSDSKVVAKFGESSYNLPKIEFSNGYKISFFANGYHSVRFMSIAGTSLANDAENNNPSWYTAAQNVTTIVLSDEVEKVYPLNKSVSFPSANCFTGDGNVESATAKVTNPSGISETVNFDKTKTFSVEGTYKITYKGSNIGNLGNTKEITFEVKSSAFTEMNDLITVEGGNLAKTETERFTGLQTSATKGYSGEINAVFNGDQNSKIEFLLPKTSGATDADLDIIFRIEDAIDASKYFEINYYYSTNSGRKINVIVKYVDENGTTQYRTCSSGYSSSREIYVEKPTNLDAKNQVSTLPEIGNNGATGYFELLWNGDVLNVKAPMISAAGTQETYWINGTLAKFDGTDTVDASAGTYGLPKISFPNGYKIKFSSATKHSILFTNIAGTDLSKDFVESIPTWYERNQRIIFVELASPIYDAYPINRRVMIPSAKYTLDGDTATVEKIELRKDNGEWKTVQAGETVFTETGNYMLRYTAISEGNIVGNVREYSFIVQEENDFRIELIGGGTEFLSYPVNYPVEIFTAQYKYLSEELIDATRIELKKDGEEYKVIEAGERVFEKAGIYTIRYTAISDANFNGNIKELKFEVKAENEYPVVFSGGGTEFNAYPVNYWFDILPAEYSLVNAEKNIAEKIEIKKGNDSFEEIVTNAVRFNETGIYTIRYTAIDGANYKDNTKEFTFEIKEQEDFKVDMTVDGLYEASYPAYYEFNIWGGSYSLLTDEVKEVAKIEVSRDGGNYLSVSEGEISFDIPGSYVIRYTAVDKGNYQGNSITFNFDITSEAFVAPEYLKELFKGNDINVKDYQVNLTNGTSLKGLLVGPTADSSLKQYSGEIGGIFATGQEMAIKLLFPDVDTVGLENFSITFKIEDVNNPNNYFNIQYYYGTMGTTKTRIVVNYDEQIRASSRPNTAKEIYTTKEEIESLAKPPATFPAAKYSGQEGFFKIVWENDVLVVKAPLIDGASAITQTGKEGIVAKFDGTDTVNAEAGTYGLPKLSFNNGYKISFSSTSAQPIMFTNISGVELGKGVRENQLTGNSSCLLQEEPLTYAATAEAVDVRKIENIGAKVNFTCVSGAYTFSGSIITYPNVSGIDFKVAGNKELIYSFSGLSSLTQTLTIVDEPPVLSFAQGVWVIETFCKGGENESTLKISKEDIEHITDEIDGVIDIENVTVFIKGPNDSNYKPYGFGDFIPENTGTYLLKYVAKDRNGTEGYIIRTINVVDGDIPIILLESAMPESVLLKQSLTLPVGSATSKGETINLLRNVYFNEQKIEIQNNILTFNEAGTYIISYYAVDEMGRENILRFLFEVEEDNKKPVIIVGEIPVYVRVGKEVSIPAYNAMDEVDGEIAVTVKVMYGATEVQVIDGKFIANKLGTYSIVLSCSDKAGNISEEIINVIAVNKLPSEDDENPATDEIRVGCSGCSGSTFGGSEIILAIAISVFLKRKITLKNK